VANRPEVAVMAELLYKSQRLSRKDPSKRNKKQLIDLLLKIKKLRPTLTDEELYLATTAAVKKHLATYKPT
jgi:hypothetical protein